MLNPYKNIYLKLNELALTQRWSRFYNENFIYLFETTDTYQAYTVDLEKFTVLYEKIEGVENTPKVLNMLKKLAEVILKVIPEIAEQENDIIIQIKKSRCGENYIIFNKRFLGKVHYQ